MPSVPVDWDPNSSYSDPQSTTQPVNWVDPTTGQYTDIWTTTPLPYTPGVPIDTSAYTSPILAPVELPKPATLNTGALPSVTTGVNLSEYIKPAILSNPTYLQGVEDIESEKALTLKRIEEDRAFWLEGYNLQLEAMKSSGSSGGSSGSGVGAALAAAAAQDKLQKEKAAHQLKLSKEAIRESMAARGLSDSGQAPFEQGELQYQYDTLIKEINLAARARAAAASAGSSGGGGGSNTANQLAELDLQKRQAMTQFDRMIENATITATTNTGKLLLNTGQALAAAYFNQSTGYYNGPGGEIWDAGGFPAPAGSAGSVQLPSVSTPEQLLGGY